VTEDRSIPPSQPSEAPVQKALPASHYTRLGLHPSASGQDIRRAYRDLSKLYHPDTTDLESTVATEKFQQLNEAYATLSNPDRRLTYDQKIGYSRINVVQPLPSLNRPQPKFGQTSSAYLDATDRPLSAGELFALFILGLTFVACLVLALTIGFTKSESALQPLVDKSSAALPPPVLKRPGRPPKPLLRLPAQITPAPAIDSLISDRTTKKASPVTQAASPPISASAKLDPTRAQSLPETDQALASPSKLTGLEAEPTKSKGLEAEPLHPPIAPPPMGESDSIGIRQSPAVLPPNSNQMSGSLQGSLLNPQLSPRATTSEGPTASSLSAIPANIVDLKD
jgi:DnaJ domain